MVVQRYFHRHSGGVGAVALTVPLQVGKRIHDCWGQSRHRIPNSQWLTRMGRVQGTCMQTGNNRNERLVTVIVWVEGDTQSLVACNIGYMQ